MIIVLTGTNSFLLKKEHDVRVQAFLAEHGDMALERVDGEEAGFERIQEAVTSMPFLATKKLVVLRAPSAQKEFTEKFGDILKGIPDSTDVLIVEPKLDKRSVYYKTLKAQTELLEFNEMDIAGLARWCVGSAKEQGGSITQMDARFLVERVGMNQQILASELQKLITYKPEVNRSTITLLTEPTPQSTIFELLDAAFKGNLKRAFQIYEEQRKLKVEPQQIIAMLVWQLHVLALLKTATGKSIDDIARASKVSPFVLKKSQQIADGLSISELKELVSQLLELDVTLKSEAVDTDGAVKNFILALSK